MAEVVVEVYLSGKPQEGNAALVGPPVQMTYHQGRLRESEIPEWMGNSVFRVSSMGGGEAIEKPWTCTASQKSKPVTDFCLTKMKSFKKQRKKLS